MRASERVAAIEHVVIIREIQTRQSQGELLTKRFRHGEIEAGVGRQMRWAIAIDKPRTIVQSEIS
jgi:hypothetical protein